MVNSELKDSLITTSIAPWLSVKNSIKATNFYKQAFGAEETYRMESTDGLVVKLSVEGAEFWLSGGFEDNDTASNQPLGGDSIRMVLTVADPDTFFARAIKAGATQIFPVGEEYGWKLGRLVDPFGLHWEIGHPLSTE